MSNQKHTVHTDALETLGKLITDSAARDAIHLAVLPAKAGMRLAPGAKIVIAGNGEAGAAWPTEAATGVVDPFLKADVHPGEWFWFIVNPRTITSLRHVWQHPAFPSPAGGDDVPESPANPAGDSVRWMQDWAIQHLSHNYYDDTPIDPETAYQMAIKFGRDHHVGPYEYLQDNFNDEWWDHWEAITGEKGDRDAYFSCSC